VIRRRRALLGGVAVLAAPALVRAQSVDALTFYYPIAVGGPIQAVIDGYCADYHKETGVAVVPVYAGNYGETLTKTLTAIRAGQGPHFAVLLAAEIHSLQDAGVLASLDEAGDIAGWADGFYPAFMANSRVDGKTWSVPFQRSTMVAYFNRQILTHAGVGAFPRDWAGQAEAAAKLVQKDGDRVTRWGIKIAGDQGNAQWTFGALANGAGQGLANEAGTRTLFDTAGAVKAMSYWRDLASVHHATPPGISAWPTLSPDFLEGNTAIIFHSTGNLTNLRDKAGFSFGVAPVPGAAGPRTVVGGGNLYMFKHASPAQREASLRFMRWVTAPERAADWSIRTGYIGTSPAAYDTPALRDYLAKVPDSGIGRDSLPVATGELSTYENQRIQKALTDQVQAVLQVTKPPAAAMAEAQADSARILRPYQ